MTGGWTGGYAGTTTVGTLMITGCTYAASYTAQLRCLITGSPSLPEQFHPLRICAQRVQYIDAQEHIGGTMCYVRDPAHVVSLCIHTRTNIAYHAGITMGKYETIRRAMCATHVYLPYSTLQWLDICEAHQTATTLGKYQTAPVAKGQVQHLLDS